MTPFSKNDGDRRDVEDCGLAVRHSEWHCYCQVEIPDCSLLSNRILWSL